jgi:hypothetical protein
MQLRRRVTKLEVAFQPALPTFTREELHVGKLVYFTVVGQRLRTEPALCRGNLEIRKNHETLSCSLRDDILKTVSKHSEAQFQEHISGYVADVWKARWGHDRYLPPVVGSEYDDWEMPDLFERRVAIRHCPIITNLIGPPAPEIGMPEYATRWDLILTKIVET